MGLRASEGWWAIARNKAPMWRFKKI
jgi:hypothetical protein